MLVPNPTTFFTHMVEAMPELWCFLCLTFTSLKTSQLRGWQSSFPSPLRDAREEMNVLLLSGGEQVLPVLSFFRAWVKEGGYLLPSSLQKYYSGAGRAGHTPMQISCRRGAHFPEQGPGVQDKEF